MDAVQIEDGQPRGQGGGPPFARFALLTGIRTGAGEAGRDHRGLWVDDGYTGTRIRVGLVGPELAADLAEQGNPRLVREALSRPRAGLWFSKTF